MGSGPSKPEGGSPSHEWKGNGPPTLSRDMIDNLRTSGETDASRAQLSELQIQTRVAEELKKLHAEADSRLRDTFYPPSDSTKPSKSDPRSSPQSSTKDDKNEKSQQSVKKEVDALRARLESRSKQTREIPASLEDSRKEVVRCLRENDRRPLDCWQEVERFKEEVRKLEMGWVDKVVG